MAVLPRVGDHFGRYRIDTQIGRGGMGVVYGATDTSIGRTVALKVVSSDLGDSEEFRARFEREAAVLARLASPHVIAIYDYGTHDGCPYIATQYVRGGDLGALLHERGPMPPALGLRLSAQIADALHDAHRVGVVHRDVKATNVLLRDADSNDLHAYLCDFGIARTATDGMTAPGSVAGTWAYLSPECGKGAPATPASDIYAVGCLLWATLTGRPPYAGTDVQIAVAHQRAPVPQLSGSEPMVDHVNRILRTALAKDPAERYETAEQLRADLLAAAELPGPAVAPVPVPTDDSWQSTPPAAPTAPRGAHALSGGSVPGSSATSPSGPGARKRWLVPLAVLAVVAVVAGGAAAALVGNDDDSDGTGAGGGTAPTGGRLDEDGPVTGDLDGDGYGDLRVSVYHRIPQGGGEPDAVVDTTDFHSDGETYVQGETERTDNVPDANEQPLVGDFDGDGTLDVLDFLGTGSGEVSVTGELSGGGTVEAEHRMPVPKAAFPGVADIDGDGVEDIVVTLVDLDVYKTEPSEYLGMTFDGTDLGEPSTFAELDFPPADGYTYVGDVDGDGKADLATLHQVLEADEDPEQQFTQELTVHLGDGSGATAAGPVLRFKTPSTLPRVVAADVDGDEDDELLVLESGRHMVVHVVDLVDGALTEPRRLGTIRSGGANEYPDYSVSDVDGNGLDDLVVLGRTGPDSARVSVGVMDGESMTVSRWATWRDEFKTMPDEAPSFFIAGKAF